MILTRKHCHDAQTAHERAGNVSVQAWRLKNASLIIQMQEATAHLERTLERCRELYPGEFEPKPRTQLQGSTEGV